MDETSRPRKRARTRRACDYCRDHRIRCDFLDDATKCEHCLDYGLVCKKVAPHPITETIKKPRAKPTTTQVEKQDPEPGFFGETNIFEFSQSCIPTALREHVQPTFNEYDDILDHFRFPSSSSSQCLAVARNEWVVESSSKKATTAESSFSFHRLNEQFAQQLGGETTLDSLFGQCHARLITVFPVVSSSEATGLSESPHWDLWGLGQGPWYNSTPPTPLPPIIRLIHCALGSLSRTCPLPIRTSLINTLSRAMSGPDGARLAGIPSLASIQGLILLSMSDELCSAQDDMYQSVLWFRLGAALRMLTDLGVHRDMPSSLVPFAQIHRRRRIFAACVIADRWLSLRMGRPLSIDLAECDAQPPYEMPDHVREGQPTHLRPCFRLFGELYKLSVFLGRAYRLTTGPGGIERADDLSFFRLQADIEEWEEQCPTTWPHSPKFEIKQGSSIVNPFVFTVLFVLCKPFWLSDHSPPAHITFRPSKSLKAGMISRAKEYIIWLETEEGAFYLDTWSLMSYPLACAANLFLLCLYESRSSGYLRLLERARAITTQWANRDGEAPRQGKTSRNILFSVIEGLTKAAEQVQTDK